MRKLKSLDEANALVEQIGDLDAIEAEANVDYQAAVSVAKSQHADRLYVDVDGEKVPLADRRKELLSRLEEYVSAHREEIFNAGKKSRGLTAGTIGYRQLKARLEAEDEKAALASVREKVIVKVVKALKSVKLGKKLTADVALYPTFAFNKSGLLRALGLAEISEEALQALGLAYVPAEDRFYVEPEKAAIVAPEALP